MSVLLSLALLISLLFSPVASPLPPPDIDISDDSEIVSLLTKIPAGAFEEGYLSYTNIQAMVDAHPGASLLPEDMTMEAWRDTAEGKAWLQAMLGASGTSLLHLYAWLADETYELTGMHPLRVKEILQAGFSVDAQYWLRGNIEKDRVIEALEAIDYVADKAEDESGWVLLCENGDCSQGLVFDKDKRNPAFIFGGDLGRRWPIAVNDDVLVSTQTEELIRAAVEPVERSLLDLVHINRPISVVLYSIEGDRDARISQMGMYKPEVFFRTPGQGANMKSVAMFHTSGEQAERVLITLSFRSKAEAEEAQLKIEEAYQTAEANKRLLSVSLEEIDGIKEDSYIDATDGDAVLVVPFRFKTTAEILEEDGKLIPPFIFFMRLQLTSGLQWLAPLDADIPTMPTIS